MSRWLLALLFAFGSVTFLTGCPEEGSDVDEAAEDVKEGAEDVADDVKDGAEELGDDVEDATD